MLCTDTDLLRWEPRLAIDAGPAAQRLFDGRGRLDGRTLRGDLPPGCGEAIVVIGDACYATLRADDASLVIGPAALGVVATMPAGGDDVAFGIRTFAAQRALVGAIVTRLGGHDAGRGRAADRVALRPAVVLGSLHLIYAGLAAATLDEHADWHVRAELYGRLYRRAMRAACGADDETFNQQEVA